VPENVAYFMYIIYMYTMDVLLSKLYKVANRNSSM